MKPNYFTIHKNKHPKQIGRKKKPVNSYLLMIPIVGAMGVAHVNICMAQIIPSYQGDKKTKILNAIQDTAQAILNVTKKANRFEFERTGKYKRKYK